MARYSVNGTVVGGKHLGVYEADSPEEAIEKAMEAKGYVSLCHACASQCEDAEITDCTAELVAEGE